MALELIKDSITLNNKAGNEVTQLLLEGDIIVPDVKPDIANILRAEGDIVIEDETVGDERVTFKGELRVNILYQAKKSEKLIHSMTGTINFEDFINIEGLSDNAHVTLTAALEHMEYKLINDRKINIKAVVNVKAQIQNEIVCEVIKDVEEMPNMQVKKGMLKLSNTVENKKDRFDVKEELSIPAGKPNIREILESDIAISDKDVRAMDGKVLIKGILVISTLYIGDTDDSLVEVVEHEVPFNGFIESKNASDDMLADAKLNVAKQSVQVIPDDDGEERSMEFDVTIGADLTVTDDEEIELVEDAYCLDRDLDITKENITYPEFVSRNKNKSAIKETLTVDGKYPDMMQVVKAWGDVTLDDVELIDDRVVAEGVVNLEIMYIAKNDSAPVSVVPMSIPFRQEIEVKGARDYMNVDITAEVENVSFSMLSEREVEVRVTLGFDVYVMKEMNGTIITDILTIEDGQEAFKPIASAVIYVVQKGDSLWSIAKKYNTTVENIVMVNDIENPDRIYPGQRLLILKKVAE